MRYINRDHQSKSIRGAAVNHQRGVGVNQQPSKLKRKLFRTTQPCRPDRYINHDSCMSTAIRRLKRKHFSSTQPCRPGWCINRNQGSKVISGAAVYRQRGVAVHQHLSVSEANALLDDTAMSTRAVSTATSKAKTYLAHLYINRDQQSESISELFINSSRTSWRKHFWTTQRVDQCGISTAISISGEAVYYQRSVAVYQQP